MPPWTIQWIPLKRALALLAVGALVGCATSPGGPVIRTSGRDGLGPVIPGCANVSPATPPLAYQTQFYLSTWVSAWSEGTQAGLQSGLRIEEGDRSRVRFTKALSSSVLMRSFGFDGSNFPYAQYCMHIPGAYEEVADALARTMPLLGNPVIRDEEVIGVYATGYRDREHTAARWRDRYLVTLRPTDSGVAVFVLRDLWIARQNSSHVRAESNGGNEAWILLRVRSQVR